MPLMVSNLYLFILAFVLAVLEIQIEGKEGWAKNLPTWRPKASSKLAKIFAFLRSGKEVTGYGLFFDLFIFLFFHWPFFYGWEWSMLEELKILSLLLIFAGVWDYLWFVLNPDYPLKNFKALHVWWHKKWFAFLPVDYYLSLIFSALLYWPVYSATGDFGWWGDTVVFFVVMLILLTVVEYIYERLTNKTFPFGK